MENSNRSIFCIFVIYILHNMHSRLSTGLMSVSGLPSWNAHVQAIIRPPSRARSASDRRRSLGSQQRNPSPYSDSVCRTLLIPPSGTSKNSLHGMYHVNAMYIHVYTMYIPCIIYMMYIPCIYQVLVYTWYIPCIYIGY